MSSLCTPGPAGEYAKSWSLKKKISYRVCCTKAPNVALATVPEEPKLFAGIFWWAGGKDRGPQLSPCPCSGKGWMAGPGYVQGSASQICCEAVTRSHNIPRTTRDAGGDVRWVEANCSVCSNMFSFELVHIDFVEV